MSGRNGGRSSKEMRIDEEKKNGYDVVEQITGGVSLAEIETSLSRQDNNDEYTVMRKNLALRTAMREKPVSRAIDIVKVLLKHGADINFVSIKGQTGDGKSALFSACKFATLEVVKFLVDNGAKLDVIDKRDENLLYVTVKNKVSKNIEEITLYLLDNGVSPVPIPKEKRHPDNFWVESFLHTLLKKKEHKITPLALNKILEKLKMLGCHDIVNVPDWTDRSVLFDAIVHHDNPKIIEVLKRHGAEFSAGEDADSSLRFSKMKDKDKLQDLIL